MTHPEDWNEADADWYAQLPLRKPGTRELQPTCHKCGQRLTMADFRDSRTGEVLYPAGQYVPEWRCGFWLGCPSGHVGCWAGAR